MPTPVKPFSVLKAEKKSHRTKEELKLREEGEKALTSGIPLNEREAVMNNPVAHAEFLRVKELLMAIEKWDTAYEPIINRYCLIQAECVDLQKQRAELVELREKLEEKFDESVDYLTEKGKAPFVIEFSREMAKMAKATIDIDRQVQQKRKMLLDIEKENVMTIASALRSIPKKVEKPTNKLLEVLNGAKE